MEIAALILSVLALIMSMGCVVVLIAQKLSTHKIELIDPAAIRELEEQDKVINKKINEIESDDEWI